MQGSGSTQACESFFSKLKQMERQTFGQRTPSLHEMIPHISAAIDHRFLIRRNLVGNKRIKYYHQDPVLQEALDTASWILNPLGIKLFFDNIKMSEKRLDCMFINDVGDGVNEKFGDLEKTYTCDGTACSCSYYQQMFLCRHIIFLRKTTGMSVFEERIFHPSLLKNASIDKDAPNHAFEDELFGDAPPSPGMEMILSEQKRTRKTPTQSKKINTALDVGRELAEIICTFDLETYEEVLNMSKDFVKQVRTGVNSKLRDYLKSPTIFSIVPVSVTPSGETLIDRGLEDAVGQGPVADEEIVNIAEYFVSDNVLHHGKFISPPSLASMQGSNKVSSDEPEGMGMVERGGMGIKVVSDRNISKESSMDMTSIVVRKDMMTNNRPLLPSQDEMSYDPSQNLVGGLCDGMDLGDGDLFQPSLTSPSQISASSSAGLGSLVSMPRINASSTELRSLPTSFRTLPEASEQEKCKLKSYMKKQDSINPGQFKQLRAATREPEVRPEVEAENGPGSSGRNWSPVRRRSGRSCGTDLETGLTVERNVSQEENFFRFSGDDTELPEPSYTPISQVKDHSNSLRFFKVTKSRGRPKIKRELTKKKSSLDLDLEMANFFPMKKPDEKQQRQRKPRSDKGKKRGSYKTDLAQNIDSNIEASLRAPRVPRTIEALQKEFGETSRPRECHSCDVLLDYDGLSEDDEDEVVMCSRCRSYLHKSCINKCAMCTSISAKLQINQ